MFRPRIAVRAAALALALAAPARAGDFTLSSPDVAEGAHLPDAQVLNGFGCSGGNRSPALAWTDPPPGTRGFALTVYDPDAPTGSGWWHWVVVDIPAGARSLPAGAGAAAGAGSVAGGGSLPAGARQTRTDFGAPGYGGACPPPGHGRHRYVFTLTALSVDRLPVDADASPAMIGFLVGAHRLGTARLTAVYER